MADETIKLKKELNTLKDRHVDLLFDAKINNKPHTIHVEM